jgi:hypothetical protein
MIGWGHKQKAVQRCNCGGAACKSAKVERTSARGHVGTVTRGHGRQAAELTQSGAVDRMIG